MTQDEVDNQAGADFHLSEERARKRYWTEEMAIFRGAFAAGFRDGLDEGRDEMETQFIMARLDNARKLEEENARL